MSQKQFLSSPVHLHASPVAPAAPPLDLPKEVSAILEPLFTAADQSSSLIASHHPVTVDGHEYDIAKFLLLGQRGGGQPIRLGLFAGFEAGNLESVRALAQLLLQLKLSPALTRDYALLAYPVVNQRGFADVPVPLSDFEKRFARDSADQDVQFFQGELRRWIFSGVISLRTDPSAKGFYATVRSDLLAADVVEPALAAASGALPLASHSVRIRPGDRYTRTADHAYGRLIPPADVRPYPFEVELVAPRSLSGDEQATGLFVVITEILRHYRSLVAHAQNL